MCMDYNRLIFRKGGLWRKNDKPMVEKVTPREWGELLEVWESAVRATHDFLSEEDLQFYKKSDSGTLFAGIMRILFTE